MTMAVLGFIAATVCLLTTFQPLMVRRIYRVQETRLSIIVFKGPLYRPVQKQLAGIEAGARSQAGDPSLSW